MFMTKDFTKDLNKIIPELLSSLDKRERFVVEKRFGLKNAKRSTLESIGRKLLLTRERVRQIQNLSTEKIKDIVGKRPGAAQKISTEFLGKSGGFICGKGLKILLELKEKNLTYNQIVFILNVSPELTVIKQNKIHEQSFASFKIDGPALDKILKEIEKIFKGSGGFTTPEELTLALAGAVGSLLKQKLEANLAQSLALSDRKVTLSKKGMVGFKKSPMIEPKSARDKAYFILKDFGKPMHFKEIAEKIGVFDFGKKAPTAATVHNELILDRRFVLIGRGIYALSEWGYERGTVEQIIEKILKESPEGMEREAIVKIVLKRRMVARNTVLMNLMLKKKFERVGKEKYRLVR